MALSPAFSPSSLSPLCPQLHRLPPGRQQGLPGRGTRAHCPSPTRSPHHGLKLLHKRGLGRWASPHPAPQHERLATGPDTRLESARGLRGAVAPAVEDTTPAPPPAPLSACLPRPRSPQEWRVRVGVRTPRAPARVPWRLRGAPTAHSARRLEGFGASTRSGDSAQRLDQILTQVWPQRRLLATHGRATSSEGWASIEPVTASGADAAVSQRRSSAPRGLRLPPTPHPPSPTRGPPRLPDPSCSAPFLVIPPGRPAPVPGASVPRPRRAAGFPLVEFLPRSRGASKGAIPSRRRSPALGCPGFARVMVSQVRPPEGTLERSGGAGLVPEAPPPTALPPG